MKTKITLKEAAGVLAVFLVLAGTPALLWAWRTAGLRLRYPAGSKIISLTATASDGIWTQDRIVGYNYWWRIPARTDEIDLNQGDHVVLLVSSADVLHSFAIPLLHIGPYDVPAGHTIEVQFDATKAGTLTFLCWQVCSPEHGSLHGRFVVKGNGAEESW